jgi:hypothetical protein
VAVVRPVLLSHCSKPRLSGDELRVQCLKRMDLALGHSPYLMTLIGRTIEKLNLFWWLCGNGVRAV